MKIWIKLYNLKKKGVISETEYEIEKNNILTKTNYK